MDQYGFVRRLDKLGRFVIPKDIRDEWGLTPGTVSEIFIDGEKIILRFRRRPGEKEGVAPFDGDLVNEKPENGGNPPLKKSVCVAIRRKQKK